MSRNKKICTNCGELKIQRTKFLCANCAIKEKKRIDPFYLDQVRKSARDYARKKKNIPLDKEICESQSRPRIFISKINFCINYLMERGYQIKLKNE